MPTRIPQTQALLTSTCFLFPPFTLHPISTAATMTNTAMRMTTCTTATTAPMIAADPLPGRVDVPRESGAVDVIGMTDVLVTSGTAQSKCTSSCYTKAYCTSSQYTCAQQRANTLAVTAYTNTMH